MVHGAGEMHVEDERHARGLAETAIGEADALGLDELRGCGLMGVSRHDLTLSDRERVWRAPERDPGTGSAMRGRSRHRQVSPLSWCGSISFSSKPGRVKRNG